MIQNINKKIVISILVFISILTSVIVFYGIGKTKSTKSSAAVPISYYVDKGNIGGTCSDFNTGTLSSPVCSISIGIAKAKIGDIVNVRAGTYTGQVLIDKGITLTTYGNEVVILDGQSTTLNGVPISGTRDGHINVGSGVTGVTVSGFIIKNVPNYGISNLGSNNTFLKNKISNTGGPGIWQRNGTNNRYAQNELFHTVLQNATSYSDTTLVCKNNSTAWPSAINAWGTSANNTWEANNIHDNCGEGIVPSSGDKIIGNTFKDNWSVNIYLDEKTDVLVDRNFVYETETTYIPRGKDNYYKNIASGIHVADEVTCKLNNNTFTNNIVVNARYGFGYYNYSSCSGVINSEILNNTFVNSWDYGFRIQGTNAANSNSIIANNLVYSNRGVAFMLEKPADLKIYNNLFYFVGGVSTKQFIWGTTTTDFNTWKATSSQISGNLWVDPQFTGTIPTDPKLVKPDLFTLKSTSPALDKGTTLGGVTYPVTDYLSKSRPQNVIYDIGAYELVQSTTTTPPVTPPTTPPASQDITIYPTEDTYVISTSPSSNFGNSTLVRTASSPVTYSYFKFDLTPLNGKTIVSAKMRLYNIDAVTTTSTLSLYRVYTSKWLENTLTYNTRPTLLEKLTSSTGATINTWKEFNLTSTIKTYKDTSLFGVALVNNSTDRAGFSSKETTSYKPRLVVVAK